MSTDLLHSPPADAATAIVEPLYFPGEAPRLFGWMHATSNHPGDSGVVICKPFGYEAICAHRILTSFTKMTAAAGFPALRFDYTGTGDSADIDDQVDQIEVWCHDVLTAVDELRRTTGVKRVCLLGFRLGALLATLAARRTSCVDSLILIAPVVNGRRYVGEMRTLVAASRVFGVSDGAAKDASLEVNGHRLSAATISALSRINLAQQAVPSVSRMLVIDRNDLPAARTWSQSLSHAGMAVEYAALPGFGKMMMVEPHKAQLPQDMLALTQQWLQRLASSGSPAARAIDDPRPDPQPALHQIASLPLVASEAGADMRLTERAVRFGPDRMLFGIVTESGSGNSGRAVVLLNAGADVHVAFGRLYVRLARQWARLGFVVLRMDLAGLGDSETRRGRPENDVFPPAALDDVRSALDFLREHHGIRDVAVGGLCAAAFHALRAAAAGLPVSGILMVNPLTYYWKEGTEIAAQQPADVVRDWDTSQARWSSTAVWKKLLSGKVSVGRMTQVGQLLVNRARIAAGSAAREVARYLRIPLAQDLGTELEEIAARGIQIVFVFARGEPGIELLRLQGGSVLKRLGSRCCVHIIETADHNFAYSGARSMLEKVLTNALLSPRSAAVAD